MKGCNPLAYAYTGEMVCQEMFWNPVVKAKYWYTPMPKGEGETILRMKQVLMAEIELIMTTKDNKVPKGCNKSKAEELGVVRIREEDIDELLEEIESRDIFDEEFNIDNDEKITNTNEVDKID